MDDINRPLRRLEVAERIRELRERAEARDTAAEVPTGALPTQGPTPSPEDPHPSADDAGTAPEPGAPDRTGAADDGSDPPDSAAAAIAGLLRRGQDWILDPGRRSE